MREKCRGTKNTATRLKWLESSVSEARGQISELGAALDRTTTLVTSLKSEVSANSLGLAITKVSLLYFLMYLILCVCVCVCSFLCMLLAKIL